MMNPKSHLLALRLIQNAQDYLQALLTQEQLATLQAEVWEDALADGVGDDLVGLFCPPGIPACTDCGTMTEGRSPCPLCHQVFCRRCAEKPYAFCCDNGVPCPREVRVKGLAPAKTSTKEQAPQSYHAGEFKVYVPPSKAPLLPTSPEDSEHPTE